MPSRPPSPTRPPAVPQNTPYPSRPTTSQGTSATQPSVMRPADSTSQLRYTFPSLVKILLPKMHLARQPARARDLTLTSAISRLQCHPTLEAALHIMNEDLPSAHFLVRHMSGPPAVEGMLLHSVLHRSEGDMGNAKAWLSDASDACAGWVPKKRNESRLSKDVVQDMTLEGSKAHLLDFVYEEEGDDASQLIDDVENIRQGKERKINDENELDERIRRELKRLVEWCRSKFGEGAWVDASEAWVRPGEEVRSIGNDMVSGHKGYRKF